MKYNKEGKILENSMRYKLIERVSEDESRFKS